MASCIETRLLSSQSGQHVCAGLCLSFPCLPETMVLQIKKTRRGEIIVVEPKKQNHNPEGVTFKSYSERYHPRNGSRRFFPLLKKGGELLYINAFLW